MTGGGRPEEREEEAENSLSLFFFKCSKQSRKQAVISAVRPNHQRWYAKMEAQSEHVHIAYRFFCTSGGDLHAQSVLVNKISASEFCRNSIMSALYWLGSWIRWWGGDRERERKKPQIKLGYLTF